MNHGNSHFTKISNTANHCARPLGIFEPTTIGRAQKLRVYNERDPITEKVGRTLIKNSTQKK